MSIRRVRELLAASLVVIASFAAASAAEAQSVITGRITDAQGNGIPAANVVVPTLGVGVGASTNATGNFTINLGTNVSVGQNLVIQVRRIGYSPQTRDVKIAGGTQTENFTMTQQVRQLDEVIVSGVSEATSARNLTISVGKVGEQQLKDVR